MSAAQIENASLANRLEAFISALGYPIKPRLRDYLRFQLKHGHDSEKLMQFLTSTSDDPIVGVADKPCISRLINKHCTYEWVRECNPPLADHPAMFVTRGGKKIYTHQAYQSVDSLQPVTSEFCEKRGLSLIISAERSWWAPATSLVIIFKPEDAKAPCGGDTRSSSKGVRQSGSDASANHRQDPMMNTPPRYTPADVEALLYDLDDYGNGHWLAACLGDRLCYFVCRKKATWMRFDGEDWAPTTGDTEAIEAFDLMRQAMLEYTGPRKSEFKHHVALSSKVRTRRRMLEYASGPLLTRELPAR